MADLCANCGQPINPFTERCYRCAGQNPPTPDLDDIRERCEAIQKTWSAHTRASRVSPIYQTADYVIPEAHEVTDHMRRNDKGQVG